MLDEILGAIFEGLLALFGALWEGLSYVFELLMEGFTFVVEFFAALFMDDATGVGVGAIFAVLLFFILELVAWLVFFLFESVMMLVQRRKARKVKKPIIWRPKKSPEHS